MAELPFLAFCFEHDATEDAHQNFTFPVCIGVAPDELGTTHVLYERVPHL